MSDSKTFELGQKVKIRGCGDKKCRGCPESERLQCHTDHLIDTNGYIHGTIEKETPYSSKMYDIRVDEGASISVKKEFIYPEFDKFKERKNRLLNSGVKNGD